MGHGLNELNGLNSFNSFDPWLIFHPEPLQSSLPSQIHPSVANSWLCRDWRLIQATTMLAVSWKRNLCPLR
jgi:hypothetical protein